MKTKTELINFASTHQLKHLSDFLLTFDGTVIKPSVWNIKQVLSLRLVITKFGTFVEFRSLISVLACNTLVCSLVTPLLGYGNAWF